MKKEKNRRRIQKKKRKMKKTVSCSEKKNMVKGRVEREKR